MMSQTMLGIGTASMMKKATPAGTQLGAQAASGRSQSPTSGRRKLLSLDSLIKDDRNL